jgi:aspartate carbamoyltransferase catalytic subunit
VHIAICGDIENSRVARSNIKLLSQFGVTITLVAPPHLMLKNTAEYYQNQYNCKISRTLTKEIIQNSQFLIFLRTQTERNSQYIDTNLSSFALNNDNLHFLQKNTFIMHPGPVNLGKELSYSAFYHDNSLINKQVQNALTGRKAVIKWFLEENN